MNRRKFLKMLASGMATGWVSQCWPGASPIIGEAIAAPNLTIACLADPHLRDGNDQRPEAVSLAQAVAEIRACKPAPRLVLFAGDLAHDGNPRALALGEEILSELAMPVLGVRGEGDGIPSKGGAGGRFVDDGRFFYTYEGVNLLGLDTVWQDGPQGQGFALGEPQQRWLAQVLPRLNPAAPLVVLSHAPLTPIYRPWGQWTRDSGPLLDHLSHFENILFLHGHGHLSESNVPNGKADRSPSHLSLPATSWPWPSPLAGTPRELRPGLGPRGCGWALLQAGGRQPRLCQVLWES